MPRRNDILSVAIALLVLGAAGLALGTASLFQGFGRGQPGPRVTAIDIVSPLARDGWPALL